MQSPDVGDFQNKFNTDCTAGNFYLKNKELEPEVILFSKAEMLISLEQ